MRRRGLIADAAVGKPFMSVNCWYNGWVRALVSALNFQDRQGILCSEIPE